MTTFKSKDRCDKEICNDCAYYNKRLKKAQCMFEELAFLVGEIPLECPRNINVFFGLGEVNNNVKS